MSGKLRRQYFRIQNRIEILKRKKAQLEGEMKSLLRELKEKHGCNSIEEAIELKRKLERDIAKLRPKVEKAIEDFETKWKQLEDEGLV